MNTRTKQMASVIDILPDGSMAVLTADKAGQVQVDVLPDGIYHEEAGGSILVMDAAQVLPHIEQRLIHGIRRVDDLMIASRLIHCGESSPPRDLGDLAARYLRLDAQRVRDMAAAGHGEHLLEMGRLFDLFRPFLQQVGLDGAYHRELKIARIATECCQRPLSVNVEKVACLLEKNAHRLMLQQDGEWDSDSISIVEPETIWSLADLLAPKEKLTHSERNILRQIFDSHLRLSLDPMGTINGGFTVQPQIQALPSESWLRNLISPPEGMVFLQADMRQQGTAVLAALAGDPIFLEALSRGVDLHALTAGHLFGPKVAEEFRDYGKHFNIAIANGEQLGSLMRNLVMDEIEARDRFFCFRSLHPAIFDLQERVWSDLRTYGAVKTPSGRRRLFPEAQLPCAGMSSIVPAAMNFLISATGQDLVKEALIDLNESGNLHNLVLVDQDSILLTVPRDKVTEVADAIVASFARPRPWWTMGMRVHISSGEKWGALKELP